MLASLAGERRPAAPARGQPAPAVPVSNSRALIRPSRERRAAAVQPRNITRQEQVPEGNIDVSERSYSPTPPACETSYSASASHTSSAIPESENSNPRPGPSDIATGIALYFIHCHRQPIWCFEREEVSNHDSLRDELACSILALTSRFSRNRDHLQLYGNNARCLIMLRIANGTVDLSTIESLCLLSYSSFIDGNVHLGQFHLSLAVQLCQSAMLDVESAYTIADQTTERKKKLFWSLQLLEQFYGRQTGLSSISTEVWRPSYSSTIRGLRLEFDSGTPPLPRDECYISAPNQPGIWNTSVHIGWVWSRVRKYVSDCAHDIVKEPWRHDSTYAMVLSDFMETENRIPIVHRYDSVKFYERKADELKGHRDYWAPWLKEQFTYHAIPTVLNHPFLYIVGAQHNPNLAIPNTFWRRSSELALLHATWIVRLIDMVVDKQLPLVDPFFGHIAAIAATVHLYYCCAAAARLKHKSNTDFSKCRRFLKSFIPFSVACEALDRNLDKMTRIAAGSESTDVEDWMPSKIYLSVPLMWDILQFNCMKDSQEIAATGLLDASLAPTIAHEEPGESSTLEIAVATSPEITIDTADGGQDSPSLSRRDPPTQTPGSASNTVWGDSCLDQTDNLTFNTTPWLYADPTQFVSLGDLGDMGYHDSLSTVSSNTVSNNHQNSNNSSDGVAWWEGGNFSNGMFGHF